MFYTYDAYAKAYFFFFQAEDGIRDPLVTGVQTCALPICCGSTSAGPMGKSSSAANAAFGLSSLGAPIATTIAPVPFRNVRRLKRRGSEAVSVIVVAPSRQRLRRGLDGRDDPEMRAAAAEPRRHRLLDLVLGGMPVPLQEGGGGHDHPVRAVAALRGLVVDEGFLDGVRLLDRAEPLERGDRLGRSGHGRRDARANRPVAEVDGAGPTLGEAAAEARPIQVELVAQDVQERRVGRRLNHVAPAVHGYDQPRHVLPPRGDGPSSHSPSRPPSRREHGPGC